MNALWDYLNGDLSSTGRIISAMGPLLLILAYITLGTIAYLFRCAISGPYYDEEIANRGSSILLGPRVRQLFAWLMQPIWAGLKRSGLPANALTTLSVLLSTAAAVAVGSGRFSLGGWLYVFAGLCDFFDGRMARATGSAGPAGAALDSILDRYSDAIILFGLGWYYRHTWVLLPISVLLLCTFMVPYIRAKAEALHIKMSDVGIMQRPERIFYIGISVALSPILEAIYTPKDGHPMHYLAILGINLVAVSTLLTAIQRFQHLITALEKGEDAARTKSTHQKALLIRFYITTAVATAIDFLFVVGLVERTNSQPWSATFIGCGVGAMVNLAISRAWTAMRKQPLPAEQIARYGFATATGALLNAGGIAVILTLPSLDYQIGWLLTRFAVLLCWTFPLNRDYVFKPAAANSDDTQESPCQPESTTRVTTRRLSNRSSSATT